MPTPPLGNSLVRRRRKTLSEREPAAYLHFGPLSAGIQHGIKKILRVTKLLNILDAIKTHALWAWP